MGYYKHIKRTQWLQISKFCEMYNTRRIKLVILKFYVPLPVLPTIPILSPALIVN